MRDANRLCLADNFSRQTPLCIDFRSPSFSRRLRQAGSKSELVARAVKPEKGLKVLDCTAGLGTDGFILAHLGCAVTMVERSPVIHALLEDGLARAREDQDLSSTVSTIQLEHGNAVLKLKHTSVDFDVLYLDPMFPEKSGSALVKGEMQILQRFLGPDEDIEALLDSALGCGVKKTVLKRPPRQAGQHHRRPDRVVSSRNSQLEVYLC